MKYWRALYGNDAADKLEVRGYRDASTSTEEAQAAALLRTTAGAAAARRRERDRSGGARNPARGGACARPSSTRRGRRPSSATWSRQAGVAANAFQFANAHRAYIYDAFATSAAELANAAGDQLYRACPLDHDPAARRAI